jgi:L-threonylcarbamoyladenylate synthase
LPTETVYGLAANALDERAVSEIFRIKGRPAHNPIIVHVAGIEMARGCVSTWPAAAEKLARSFWPGPLTLVLPKSNRIPGVVTAGGSTVGVRWPRHPFIETVIRECGFPLAAPSANRSMRVSPTTAEHVAKEIGAEIPLIVDGGPAQVGIESTVLDLTSTPPRVLRPGMIHVNSINAVIGEVSCDSEPGPGGGALRSPGRLNRHYSPRAKLEVMSWRDDAELRGRLPRDTWAGTHVIAYNRIPAPEGFARVSVIPQDAEAFARALYAELHACDDAGAERIVIEAPPDAVEWRAISDRLKRAASQ